MPGFHEPSFAGFVVGSANAVAATSRMVVKCMVKMLWYYKGGLWYSLVWKGE